jgi:glycosyltransferase involved in cell wall biosynthesis
VHDVGPRSDIHDRDIEGLMELLGDNRPVVAFVNSAESRHIGQRLARYGIPVISLIHETPSYYPVEDFDLIYRSSRRVVFPSAYIDDSARGHCPYPEGLAVVRGQGLLRPGFGQLDREQARRKVFQELGLGSDAALVIGCGAVNFRKGADLFLSTAAALDKRLQDKPGARPVFFCWLGSGPDYDDLQREVERSKMRHAIRFVGPRPDVERYFVAGDVFALTSRSDPYPCVVHEAMAAGMPVVGFAGGGGAAELFSPDAGETVAFGDTEAMAGAIEALVFDDARRLEMGQAARRTIAERGSNEAYFQHMLALAGEVTGLDLEHRLGQRRTRSGRKVFFLAPDWGVSGVNSLSESLVNGLNARGFEAEVVFTRGRFGYWETDYRGRTSLPDAPYSRLEPAANTAAAIWEELAAVPGRAGALRHRSELRLSRLGDHAGPELEHRRARGSAQRRRRALRARLSAGTVLEPDRGRVGADRTAHAGTQSELQGSLARAAQRRGDACRTSTWRASFRPRTRPSNSSIRPVRKLPEGHPALCHAGRPAGAARRQGAARHVRRRRRICRREVGHGQSHQGRAGRTDRADRRLGGPRNPEGLARLRAAVGLRGLARRHARGDGRGLRADRLRHAERHFRSGALRRQRADRAARRHRGRRRRGRRAKGPTAPPGAAWRKPRASPSATSSSPRTTCRTPMPR